MHGKQDEQNAYYQVFIEPKGKHLAGDYNYGWKERFLEKISERYGLEKIVMEKENGYILIGLPFFNDEDKLMKKKFEGVFQKIV